MRRLSWVLAVLLAVPMARCSSQPTVVAEDNAPLQDVVEVPADDGGTGPDEAWDSRVPEDGDAALADDPSTGDPKANDPSTNDPSVEAPSTGDLSADEAIVDTADLVEAEALPPDALPDADIDACTPECGEAECGDDGCGGTCGECTGGKVCTGGTCECMERAYRACCDNAVCWFDSCGTKGLWIVDCPKGCEASRCVDGVSQCQGKVCGEDGYGGECGQCAAGHCEGLDWTQPGACVNGQCMDSGIVQTCDDFQPCTRDICDPRFGCRHKARADGYLCEAGRCEALTWSRPRTCAAGACTGGGGTEACLDENLCTDDTCSAEAGCVFTPNTTACDDGDPCTATDVCAAGTCVGTDARNCDDGNACTTDSCTDISCASALQADFCLIAGPGCVASGQLDSSNPCLICMPSTSTITWTALGEGSSCGTGQVCHLDDCCTRQCGGKICGDDGCGGTCGTCSGGQVCDGGACVNPTCGDTACPILAGYNVACNAQAHCEYANPDTTGWKQWDVWIWIPPGSFTMGSPAGESGRTTAEDPNHVVTFAKGYLIGKYEVTVAAYEACETASPGTCTAPSTADWDGAGWGTNRSGNGRSTHPQNGLTWDQAGAACTWLGGLRPSEAEWEYAATGPTHRKFPWGDTPEPDCTHAVFNGDASGDPPWGCEPCATAGCSGTEPVGTKPAGASWCGALDMAGNAWEWVEDWWHPTYTGAPTDGSAWVSPAGSDRLLRGAGFNSGGPYLRSSWRTLAFGAVRYAFSGARCVRSLP